MSYSCITFNMPSPCAVAVSSVTFDPATCTVTVVGSGVSEFEYSIDGGITWQADADFTGCFDEGQLVEAMVRSASDINCVSDVFNITIEDKIILFVGNKNTLADGLSDNKESLLLAAIINAGYTPHYEKASVLKNDYVILADLYAEHPCVKAIWVGPTGKDVKDSPILTWDIPVVIGGHKDIYKDLDLGSDQGEDNSSPKNNITVTNNTDPSGIINSFALGQVEFSTKDKKNVWAEPTGDFVTLANHDGDSDKSLVWYVAPGDDYGGGTTVNYLIGLPFSDAHPEELTAEGATMVVDSLNFAYANRASC